MGMGWYRGVCNEVCESFVSYTWAIASNPNGSHQMIRYKNLTEAQQSVLDFMVMASRRGRMPTLQEIATLLLKTSSPSAACSHIAALENKGFLKKGRGGKVEFTDKVELPVDEAETALRYIGTLFKAQAVGSETGIGCEIAKIVETYFQQRAGEAKKMHELLLQVGPCGGDKDLERAIRLPVESAGKRFFVSPRESSEPTTTTIIEIENATPAEGLIEELDKALFPAVAGTPPRATRRQRLDRWREALSSCRRDTETVYRALLNRDPAIGNDAPKVKAVIQLWCAAAGSITAIAAVASQWTENSCGRSQNVPAQMQQHAADNIQPEESSGSNQVQRSQTKHDRNRLMVEEFNRQEKSLQEIGRDFGVSRQRVLQIVKR